MAPQQEATIRLTVFLSGLVLIAVVESLAPRKARTCSRLFRWTNNLALTFLNTVVVRFVLPLSAVSVAEISLQNGWGLLHFFKFPLWANIIFAVVSLDLLIYLQHVLFHAVGIFWRLHRVHHADHDIDVTTGLRFHPIEILLSMLLKMGAVLLIGAHPLSVIVFELILNTTAMFNHGNIDLPIWLDKFLRWFLVTPDMHRIHHSTERDETDSNYGFNLPWWDYLFKTYRAEPRLGQEKMKTGLPEFPDSDVQRLDVMLLLPLRNNNNKQNLK